MNKFRSVPAVVGALTIALILALTVYFVALKAAPSAQPLFVTSTNDLDDGVCSSFPGHCSLREAINAANANHGLDTIDFHSSVTGTITLASPLPAIAGDATIIGPGAPVLTVDANHTGSVLEISSGVIVDISGLTITGGSPAGILNLYGTLTVTSSSVIGNTNTVPGQAGGGIASFGPLTVVRSTISGNSSISAGAAIDGIGSVVLRESTISGNSGFSAVWLDAGATISGSTIAANSGFGVYGSAFGPVTLQNTILAGNHPNCGGFYGDFPSLGHNLSSDNCTGTDPSDLSNVNLMLGPLQNNGGPTDTHALQPGSPAIDAGDDSACPATDQRGNARPAGAHCDIGAYEYRATLALTATPTVAPTPACDMKITKTASPNPVLAPGPVTYVVTVENVGAGPCTADAGTPNSIQDLAPAGVTFGTPTTVPPSGSGWSCPTNPTVVACVNPSTIPPSGAVTFTFTANVGAAATSPIHNCATTNSKDDPLNTASPGNNQACADVIVNSAPACNVTVTKDANPSSLPAGSMVDFRVTVMLSGNCSGLQLTDTPGSGLNINPFTQPLPRPWSCPGNVFPCSASGNVPAGSYTFYFSGTSQQAGTYQNCADVNQGVNNVAQDCLKITFTGVGCDMTITKTRNPASPALLAVGTQVTFTISVQNIGSGRCQEKEVCWTDNWPSGLVVVSQGTTPAGWAWPAYSPGASPGPGACIPGPIAANSPAVTFTITVAKVVSGSLTNCAEVKITGDIDPSNDQSCVTF